MILKKIKRKILDIETETNNLFAEIKIKENKNLELQVNSKTIF